MTERVAVVTGAASGIGLAIAERLAFDGRLVALLDRDHDGAQKAAEKIEADGFQAAAFPVDVTDRVSIESAVDSVASRLGPPTILVNSAGLSGNTPFLDIQVEEWNIYIGVNLTGTFHCCQVVIPYMLEAGWGRIVNISSSSAHSGVARMSHYVSSKSGVNGLTKCLALEFAPHGITVNAIPPGFIDTPMLRQSVEAGLFDMNRTIATTPVGRPGQPEDVAAACAFLVGEEAGYITGAELRVNGGRNT